MAAITRLPEITEKGLATIPGIGEKRIARYGKQLIELYYADGGVLSASGLQKGGLP